MASSAGHSPPIPLPPSRPLRSHFCWLKGFNASLNGKPVNSHFFALPIFYRASSVCSLEWPSAFDWVLALGGLKKGAWQLAESAVFPWLRANISALSPILEIGKVDLKVL